MIFESRKNITIYDLVDLRIFVFMVHQYHRNVFCLVVNLELENRARHIHVSKYTSESENKFSMTETFKRIGGGTYLDH